MDAVCQLYEADCLEVLAGIPADSFDACVTDPPYHLTSGNIAVDWGALGPNDKRPNISPTNSAGREHKTGFMGKTWDGGGVAFDPNTWRAIYRVLKPGGHMLVFGGTRTQHRMVCAIEDAGFEIRDTVLWLYGSGFPKSLDVSKQIDKDNGKNANLVKFTKWFAAVSASKTNTEIDVFLGLKSNGATAAHYRCVDGQQPRFPRLAHYLKLKKWLAFGDKWDAVIKEAEREIIGSVVKGSSPLPGNHTGTWADSQRDGVFNITAPATPEAAQWDGWGTALKPAVEMICLARKPLSEKTVAANVLRWGCGALNVDACRVAQQVGDKPGHWTNKREIGGHGIYGGGGRQEVDYGSVNPNAAGRWPANLVHDGSDEVEAAFAVFGERAAGNHPAKRAGLGSSRTMPSTSKGTTGERQPTEAGSASRFYYAAKANKADRVGSKHPTVKPQALMRWLCTLITPPGGRILDPFAGSGSTGQAALDEGFSATLIEREAEYCQDIRRRIG